MIGRIPHSILQLSVLLTALGTAAAQHALSGVVEGPTGQPVAGARVAFFDDPRPAFAAPPATARPPACEDRSDASGRFRLQRRDAPFDSGAVWAEGPGGLCAFLPAVTAAGPLRVCLDEGSAVRTTPADDGVLRASALVPDGLPCYLGPLTTGVLPPGRFRLLQRAACGWNEHDVSVRAGAPCVLPQARAAAQFVAVPPGFTGAPRLPGWPATAIELRVQDGRIAVPPGPSPRALLFAERVGTATLWREVTCRTATGVFALPARSDAHRSIRVRAALPFAEAPLAQAIEPAGSGWQARAWCNLERAGDVFTGTLPIPDAATAILITCPGFAPSWQALEVNELQATLVAGHALTVQIEPDAVPEPSPAVVELSHREASWLTLTARTDALGRVTLGDLPAGGVRLHVRRPGYRQEQRDLELIGADTTVRVALQSGPELHGTVVLADGSPGARAIVVLRDPTGMLRTEPMRTFADPQGRFAFRGLPEDGPMTLSAALERDTRTWSAQRHGIRPGDEIVLELRLEDPAPPNARRRDR